jgi:hypothetical protein
LESFPWHLGHVVKGSSEILWTISNWWPQLPHR